MGKNHITRYILQNHFLTAILVLGFLWFLFSIQNILVALFIAYIFMAALSPFVELLKRLKFPRILAVSVAFLSTFTLLLLIIFPLIPFFFAQIQSLYAGFPLYLDTVAKMLGLSISANQLDSIAKAEIGTIGQNAIMVTGKVFNGLFSVLTIMVVSFYLMLDHMRVKKSITGLFPEKSQKRAYETLLKIEYKLGAWFRGQIVLCAFIGGLTWVVLTMLGVQFALPLALIAGFLEVIPTLGPILSAVPAVIVTLAVTPGLTPVVILAYILIQAVENNFLVPKIMQKAVGLNPIIVIIGIIVGGELMGILGALLSIPFISMLVIVFSAFQEDAK